MTISISDITTGSINGTGDFDLLMKAAKEHLQLEYSYGRITSDKYAEAYIALMGQVLGASIQFKLQSEQVNKQSELADEQKALIVAQTAQVTAETSNVPKQGILLDKQATKVDADTQLTNAQILNIPKEGIVLDRQVLSIDKDIEVKDKDIAVKDIQIRSVQSQISLTDQKTITEKAQTVDIINGAAVQGTVGKQKEVYDAQIKGFENDAIQKATKTMTDIWSVQRSTDVGIQPTPETKLYDSNIGSAVSKLFGNLNIPLASVPMAAFVNAESATTGSDTLQANEAIKFNGNLGDNGASVTSVTVRDADSKVVASTDVSVSGKTFTGTITAVNVAGLKQGDLTLTAKIRTAIGSEITVSDGVRKGY